MESHIYQLILHFLTLFTVLVQFYVVFLVQNKSPKSMREYRFFLNIFTAWDMLFTFMIGVFLQPDSVPNLMAAWTRGLASYLGPYGELVAACLSVYAGANVVMAQDYCLTYRFTVIHPNKTIHQTFMARWYKAVNLIGHQLGAIFLAVFLYQAMLKPGDIPSYIAKQNSAELSQLIHPGDFILGLNLGSKITHLFMATMLISFIVSEILCITLICLIMSILRKNAALFSRATYKLHFQFTILLAAQLLTPFVFIILPVAACLIAAFFGLYSPQFAGQLGFILITLYGVTNSLFTIIFVGPYRAHARKHILIPMLRSLVFIKVMKPLVPTKISTISSSFNESSTGPTVRRANRSGSLYASVPANRLF